MNYRYIQIREENAIATLTLNRPDVLNALHMDMAAEMIHAVDRVRDTGSARVLVITGAGRAFAAGADLNQMAEDVGGQLESHFNPLLERMQSLPCPIVGSVNGAAAGVACSLALACDFVIAARSAYFLEAFVNIGLVPDMGSTWLLPRLVGLARAKEMMMLGERISAEKAEQWGLIYKMVEDQALAAETQKLAERFANGPTRSYAMVRHAIHYGLERSLTETIRLERFNQRTAGNSPDAREGMDAFRNKRKAKFTGK
jgi:2-(1,2-epoxy-1,2-dihydrophenyl)acetyl-CoA isomerase